VGAPDFPKRPLTNKFLYIALVHVNTYIYVPNFNFLAPLVTEIWRGSQNKKLGAADLLRRILADKLLHVAIVHAYAYQRTKFQLCSSISFGDMSGVPK